MFPRSALSPGPCALHLTASPGIGKPQRSSKHVLLVHTLSRSLFCACLSELWLAFVIMHALLDTILAQVLSSLQLQMKDLASLVQMLVPQLEKEERSQPQSFSDNHTSSSRFQPHPKQISRPFHDRQSHPHEYEQLTSSSIFQPQEAQLHKGSFNAQLMEQQAPDDYQSRNTAPHPHLGSDMDSGFKNHDIER